MNRLSIVPLAVFGAFMTGCTASPSAQTPAYDLVLRGGRVVDGTGNPWILADVGVKDGKIAAVGRVTGSSSRTIDATGLVVAPGFIDLHTHSDQPLINDGNAESKVRQGVTLDVLGERPSVAPRDGLPEAKSTWTDFTGYWKALGQKGTSMNVISEVSYYQIREVVKGYNLAPATPTELERMKQLAARSMREGAWGLVGRFESGGPENPNEVVEIAKVVASMGGIYVTHIGSEGAEQDKELDFAIRVADEAKMPVHIFHLKIRGKSRMGTVGKYVAKIEAARARGLDVTANQYPYTAMQHGWSAFFPVWAREHGPAKFAEILRDPKGREEIKKDPDFAGWVEEHGGWDGIVLGLAKRPDNKKYEGMRIAEIAKARGDKDPADTCLALMADEGGTISGMFHTMSEGDVRLVMRLPWVAIASDGSAINVNADGLPHPRSYSTNARVLGHYVRDEKVLTLEDAVRKMTSLPAQILGLRDRGQIREGFAADLVAFDPAAVGETNSFEKPKSYAKGVPYTIVNGVVVIDGGKHTNARPGKAIMGRGFEKQSGARGHMTLIARSFAFVVLSLSISCSPSQPPYDIVIAGGSVIDGTGAPAVMTDVGVRAGRIATIGPLGGARATRRIDAKGLVVAPGFIDMHNHSDYTILVEPKAESAVRQGLTTLVLGESRSAGPLKAGQNDDPRSRADKVAPDWTTLGGYFQKLEAQHMATNIASYVGEEQVWTYVKGYRQSPATPDEIEQMKKLVAQAMEEGAMGLSTALLVPPSSLATTENLIELAKVSKQYGGIYSSHIRDEGERVFEAVKEAIDVGKGANIHVDILHMKIAHKKLWGRVNEIIAMVQKARDEGLNIQANVYPYTAGQNNLSSIIPPWAVDGGPDQMIARLKNPALRPRLRREILNGLPGWYNHYLATGDGWGGMILVTLQNDKNKAFQGKRMSELIAARGGNPADVLMDVLIEENGSVPTVFFHHSEPDMQLVMKQPWTSIGSDGGALSVEGPTSHRHPHPRYFGTFPRVLGRYVRELQVITLPEAVKKMTSMNADKIGIKDRGRLQEGLWADITVFNPATVIDRATFEKPHQYPVGIDYVIVNGTVTIDKTQHSGALAGRVLYGPGKK